MFKSVDQWASGAKPKPEDEVDRLAWLEEQLENYGFHYDYGQVLMWHGDYTRHGVYPFGRGTYADQPANLLTDFETLDKLTERAELRRRYMKTVAVKAG
jgi:hypothetical protein